MALSDLYRQRTMQCLLIADITKCAPYALETSFYITAEHSLKGTTGAGIYIMVGVLVQTALQMDHHRSVLPT